MKRPSVFAIVIGVVVVLGIVSIVATRQGSEPGVDPATTPVSVEGRPLPGFDGLPDDAVGQTAPELGGSDLDGEPMSITHDGRPKAIAFLAHWCPHCQDEVSDLVAWLETNELPDGADVYAVSTLVDRTRGNYPPDAWLAEEGWPFPTLVDDAASAAAAAYGLSGTPFWVFLDGDGEVVVRRSGVLGGDVIAQILAELEG